MAHFIKKEDNHLQLQRKLEKAGALLGFTKNQAITAEMVRKRFVELVKDSHPDTGVGVLAGMPLDDIRKAKDFILKHMEDGDA